jgi:hypothetical protein
MLQYRHASWKSTTKSKKIQVISVNLESYINNYKNMEDTNNMNPHAIASSFSIQFFFFLEVIDSNVVRYSAWLLH